MKVEFEIIAPDRGSSFKLINWRSENDKFFWHQHPEYEIIYVKKGSGKLHIGNHLGEYQEGEVMFLGPNLPHTGLGYGVIGEHEEIIVQLKDIFLGNDFMSAAGKYILATPTDGAETNEKSGIWFLSLASGSPAVGLTLPTLPAGWKYEGWVVTGGKPVTTGKFTAVDMVDESDPFSSTMPGPPFPGEDYLVNAPSGLTFPTDLSGGTAVISIEPEPDNSPAPFVLKPLVAAIPDPAMDHTTYDLTKNLSSFPTGTATK